MRRKVGSYPQKRSTLPAGAPPPSAPSTATRYARGRVRETRVRIFGGVQVVIRWNKPSLSLCLGSLLPSLLPLCYGEWLTSQDDHNPIVFRSRNDHRLSS